MVLWFYGFMSRSIRRLAGGGSDFKASQKTEPQFKVSSHRLGEAGNQPATPGLQDIGLSPTPWWLQAQSFQEPGSEFSGTTGSFFF